MWKSGNAPRPTIVEGVEGFVASSLQFQGKSEQPGRAATWQGPLRISLRSSITPQSGHKA